MASSHRLLAQSPRAANQAGRLNLNRQNNMTILQFLQANLRRRANRDLLGHQSRKTLQQSNTSLAFELTLLSGKFGVISPTVASRCSCKPQAASCRCILFEFAKAALPSHRHLRKPARFEFTRHVRLQADTRFGHLFCRTTVSKCEYQKREIQAFGGRGHAPCKRRKGVHLSKEEGLCSRRSAQSFTRGDIPTKNPL